jgi:putative transposase
MVSFAWLISGKQRLKLAVRCLALAQVIERHRLSQRRACRLLGIDHSVLRYQPRRPNDTELRNLLREPAAQRRRFGYRRLGW